MKNLKTFEDFTSKKILNMDNVNDVPEANHIITPEDNEKIHIYFKEEQGDESVDDYTGMTLKQASLKMADGDEYEDEHLMHFIISLFGDKYDAEV